MKKTIRKSVKKPRRTPGQSRSTETVAVIVEAAARVLEEKGLEEFNTNAVAGRGGVSIGSVYQYFRNKDALLASLMERETELFVTALAKIPEALSFQEALLCVVEASVKQQLRRPELARQLDFVEKQQKFKTLEESTAIRIQCLMFGLLSRAGAPQIEDRTTAALEVLSVIRALTDAAGERGDKTAPRLARKIHAAVSGYLGIGAPEEYEK